MTDPYAAPTPPATPVAVSSNPGVGLGIAGLVLDFFIPPLGLVLSIVGKVQSRGANVRNTVATVGIVLGVIFTVGGLILAIVLGAIFAGVASECATLGNGTHVVGGTTYTCN